MARPRSDIAPRIVHAARDRFLAEGVDGASLRRIALDAGTSIGMVYYYFPTKDDLFFAVVEETYTAVLAKLAAALEPKRDPLSRSLEPKREPLSRSLEPDADVEARLGRLFRAVGSISDDEVLTIRLVVREALVSSKRLERLLERFQRGHIPLVVAALAEGVQNGRIDAGRSFPVLFMSTLALGVVPQFMRRIAGDRLPIGAMPPAEVFADELVHVLFHGIGARGGSGEAASREAPTDARTAKRERRRGGRSH